MTPHADWASSRDATARLQARESPGAMRRVGRAWRRLGVAMLACLLPLAASATQPIVARMVVEHGTASTATVAQGQSAYVEVRIDAPAVSPIGASFRVAQTSPPANGFLRILGRSQAGSPFVDASGGASESAVTAYPGSRLDPDNDVNLGNNVPGLAGIAPASNILVATLRIDVDPATPPGTYRIQPVAGVSFATEVTTQAQGADWPMSDAFFDSVVVAPTVPGPPSYVRATPGNAQATVSFNGPWVDGGSIVTSYTVTSQPPGGVDAQAGTDSTTRTITGLTNGTSYTFTVRATNAVGTGPASDPSNSVTPGTGTNTALASLVSTVPLSPSFAPATLAYTTSIVGSVYDLRLTPTPADPNASVSVAGWWVANGGTFITNLSPGSNTIPIVVTAQNGVATQTYTVTAYWLPTGMCAFTLSPLDLSNRPASGGAASVTVTSAEGCPVAAVSRQPWVSVVGVVSILGNTTVSLQIAPNTGPARSTAIQIADRLFLVTQSGP
jgi:hypothetical protein